MKNSKYYRAAAQAVTTPMLTYRERTMIDAAVKEVQKDAIESIQEVPTSLVAEVARHQAAEEIRRELVCCDVYEKYHDRGLPDYMAHHAICFWAEAAARLTEQREDVTHKQVS